MQSKPLRTIADIEREIGVCFNPVDGRSWYRMLGENFGDWDCTCGHYRRANADGSVVLVRDDTMAEINAKPRYGDPLASGWAHMIEDTPHAE